MSQGWYLIPTMVILFSSVQNVKHTSTFLSRGYEPLLFFTEISEGEIGRIITIDGPLMLIRNE